MVVVWFTCFLCVFPGRTFLINLRRQFRVRNIFSRRQLYTQGFTVFAVFLFVFKGTLMQISKSPYMV